MSDAQHAAIVLELRRLTLSGKPERPELLALIVEPASPQKRRRRG